MWYNLSMNKNDAKTLARLRREDKIAAMRDGRINRATTQPDKRKKASKDACRKGNW